MHKHNNEFELDGFPKNISLISNELLSRKKYHESNINHTMYTINKSHKHNSNKNTQRFFIGLPFTSCTFSNKMDKLYNYCGNHQCFVVRRLIEI